MLFEHAMALATTQINSIEHLEMLVKQRESAKASQMAYKRQMNMLKPTVNEIDNRESNSPFSGNESESENENELCAFNSNGINQFKAKQDPRSNTKKEKLVPNKYPSRPSKQAGTSGEKRMKPICFNCRKRGHIFNDCQEKVTRIFCFRCGKNDNIAPTCSNCFPSKNGDAASFEVERAESDNESEK